MSSSIPPLPFAERFIAPAKSLLKGGGVKEPHFSRGTYQIEVKPKGKKSEFPFLQLADDGTVRDAFCSCKDSDGTNGCVHLMAAYLRIFNGHLEPLHVRFRHSLWNRLCQMASKRHKDDPSCLAKEEKKYIAKSKTGKTLFSIEGKTAQAKARLKKTIEERAFETEETSIKFFNWSADEMADYKAGTGSFAITYELSFWSDLAKWLMYLDDEQEPYELTFSGHPIPSELYIHFPDLGIWFYVAEVNWPWIIPSLTTVKSPLAVVDRGDESIASVTYDEKEACLNIHHKAPTSSASSDFTGHPLGGWLYVEGKGFYKQRHDPLFDFDVISKDKIGQALSSSAAELSRFLPIHGEAKTAKYRLSFDRANRLHIHLYIEEPDDLASEQAHAFVPWVYIPSKGFYLVEGWIFEGKEKVVSKEEIDEFINRHRVWLHQFPGFQTHLGSLESHLTYALSEEGVLSFDATISVPDEEIIQFDEWIYIRGQGFYMRKVGRSSLPLHPGLTVTKENIASFIASHKDDLEHVQAFFAPSSPVETIGLVLSVTDNDTVLVEPKMEWRAGINPSRVRFFGDFAYLEPFGFSEVAPQHRLPERFRDRVELLPSQESAFFAYELDNLTPFITSIDPRLQRPTELNLKIRRIYPTKTQRRKEWLVDFVYESTLGSVDLVQIWDAFQNKKRHLFSKAGLLHLHEARFNWIRQLARKRIDHKRNCIRLNTLEWIRLSVFETLSVPKGDDTDAVETRKLLEEISRLEATRPYDASLLKSQLRPYQEQGLHWLWFLYCHGLSGLLCDDMGLGKTHQAMALLAAISKEDEAKENKYLVVCPTSVIYHWQELLGRFLPHLRVCTYYGLERSLDQFMANSDLLLTSYGILRTGRDNLRIFPFMLAIFDEIQIAKNHLSQTHRSLKAIASQMKLGLSGTPIENRLRELKSLIDVVLPSYLPPDPIFRDLFLDPIEKHQDDFKKKLLSKLVKPFILRRKKSEVLRDLPEKIEEIAYCDLSEEQKQLYKNVTSEVRASLLPDLEDVSKPVSYVHIFSVLTRLKQICDHPCLIDEADLSQFEHHPSGKWDLFVELLHEALGSGQKVVIFSQYLKMLSIIELYLKKKGIGYASLKGSTRDRSEPLRRFRDDPKCEVFVASLLAAGVGIDLTAGSIVIHYDRWWNPAKENQATDRVHRIGQNRGVQVFKLVTKHTIEEHIHELIEKKKGLLEDIVGESGQIQYLNRDELLHVFRLMMQETQ
ncbi:MAG: hypothetical protein RL235_349 [Chlamydiota bacterium]|jgi:SNF2 family DNA or RNA helicase